MFSSFSNSFHSFFFFVIKLGNGIYESEIFISVANNRVWDVLRFICRQQRGLHISKSRAERGRSYTNFTLHCIFGLTLICYIIHCCKKIIYAIIEQNKQTNKLVEKWCFGVVAVAFDWFLSLKARNHIPIRCHFQFYVKVCSRMTSWELRNHTPTKNKEGIIHSKRIKKIQQ